MKERMYIFWLLGILFVANLWVPVLLQAEEHVFTETFDNPTLPGWEHSPNAQAVNGVLHIEPDGYVLRAGEWGNLELNIIARRIGDSFVVTNYRVGEGGDYALLVGGDEILLLKAGSFLAQNSLEPFPLNEWFSIQVHLEGGDHEIMFNGLPVLTAHDPEPLPPGGIALATQGVAGSEFEEISLISLDAKDPSVSTEGAPAYQSEPWIVLGGPPGGIGYDIRMVSEDPDIMYVTDSGAGIFKSIDDGLTWAPINQGVESFPDIGTRVFCATIDPHDSNAIWIGTQLTGHIYQSTDGGQTWDRRDNGIIPSDSGEHSVRGITIDPNEPNIVYAAFEDTPTIDGLSRSYGEVYKSSDAGLNWIRIWQGENLARYVWIDPRDTQRLFVSTGIFDRIAANADSDYDGMTGADLGRAGGLGILRSEDGGQTWTVLNEKNGLDGGLYIPSLFMHPQYPDMLIAAVSAHGGRGTKPGVYITRDSGDTWTLIQPAAVETGAEVSMEAVEISSSNPNIWYAAAGEVIHRSDDGGQTWTHFPLRTADRGSGFPIDIQVDPRDPYRLFVNGYGGGNMMSTDGGETWVDASKGYSGAGIWGLFVAPGNSRTVTVSANTANFRSTDGGQTWRGFELGRFEDNRIMEFRGRVVSCPEGSGTHIMASGGLNIGYVYHSTDGGNTWQASKVVDIEDMMERGELINSLYVAKALAFAPSDPNTVYIGYGERYPLLGSYVEAINPPPGFFRSQDGGYTWEHVVNTPFTEVTIFSLAVSLDDPSIIYIATMAGIFLSHDGGDTWQRIESLEAIAPSYPDEKLPPIIVVTTDPFESGIVYAGSPRGGVFRSKDGGDTWEQVGYGMEPNESISDMLPDHNRPGLIYASTKGSGIYYTTDRGGSWMRLNEGISNLWVDQMALSDDGSVLYAGTRVSGVIRLGIPTEVPPDTP